MKSYLTYFKLRLKVNLQYRSAALAGILTQLFFALIFILLYLAFYESGNEELLPMNFSQMCSFIWLQQAFYSLIYPVIKDSEIIEEIKSGNLAYELIKPQSYYWKNFVKMYAKRIVNAILRAPIVLIIGFLIPKPYGLLFPNNLSTLLFFILSMILSSLLVTSINMLVHIFIMFTMDEKGLFPFFRIISEILSGMDIPIAFFSNFIQKILYLLPFCFLADFPFRVYSGNINLFQAKNLINLSIIWLLVIIVIGNLITKLALKKAVIQGG